jgi:hypothetical protein
MHLQSVESIHSILLHTASHVNGLNTLNADAHKALNTFIPLGYTHSHVNGLDILNAHTHKALNPFIPLGYTHIAMSMD